MKTNMIITMDALNAHYLTNANIINADYLCEAITMWAINTQNLYNAVMNSNRKITSIVYETLIDLANDHIKSEGYKGYQCSSYQIKKWLNTYSNGYDTLAKAVEELTEERKNG